MTWLEEGVLLRRGFDPLCFDSRFQNLLHRVGLPYSKSVLQIPSGSTYAWARKEPLAAFTLWAATACSCLSTGASLISLSTIGSSRSKTCSQSKLSSSGLPNGPV
jgi:hypothetical protein